MVDFNNDVTVSTPADAVEKISLLERRYNFLEAYEYYLRKKEEGIEVSDQHCRARVKTLFLQLSPMLGRREEQIHKEVKELLDGDEWLEAFQIINRFLDSIEMTKVDTKRQWDRTNVEVSNRMQGL